jgi:hypothetical protein
MAGGAAAQAYGAEKARKAQDEAISAENQRQKKYSDQSMSEFDKSLEYNQGESQQQRENRAAQNLDLQYQNAIAGALTPASGTGVSSSSSPKIIADTYSAAMQEAKNRLSKQMSAKASLGGFGDMLSRTRINNSRISDTQNMIGGLMRGSSAILPLELQKASHKGDAYKNVGALLSLAGNAGAMYGIGSAANAAGASGAAGSGGGGYDAITAGGAYV